MKLRSFFFLALLAISGAGESQISFSTAVDLALRNSPRVKMAEADVARTRAILQESRDVYIPVLSAGSGLGYTYGFPVGTPTLYSFTAQALIFDQSQQNYIRAARSGLEAANLSLQDVRQQIAEDAALSYLALDADLQRLQTLKEQYASANKLVSLTEDRLNAGLDTRLDLTRGRLSAAQIHLRRLLVEDDMENQSQHLMRLTGIPTRDMTTDGRSIPAIPTDLRLTVTEGALSPAVQAAYANAQSHLQQAFGDSRKLYRPQIALATQYNRFASFNNYSYYYQNYSANNFSFGIQLNLPIIDLTRRAKARESLAEAARTLHQADLGRDQFLEGRTRVSRSVTEMAARTEVASLDRELAQDQLDVVRTQLTLGNPNGQPITPKDEQDAMVQERQKYLDYLDADAQLRSAQINLLRSSGQLELWLKASLLSASPAVVTPFVP